MRAPTSNAVTQGQHGQYNAVDYSAYPDPNIYAPEDGKIVSQFVDATCGNAMHLQGATGKHGFCHLERYTVPNGAQVTKGQVIGIMGYTGYTIPSGPAGRHLHWVLNINGAYVYPPSKVNETGGTMSTTDLGIARVLAYHILGRTESPNNALAGQSDADLIKNHVGKETNAKIWEFYNSPEGKAWREQRLMSLYADRANLANVTADRNGLIVKLDAANKKITELSAQNATLATTVNEQKATITAQEAEIKRLNNELSNRPTTPTDESEVVKSWFSRLIDKIIFWNKE